MRNRDSGGSRIIDRSGDHAQDIVATESSTPVRVSVQGVTKTFDSGSRGSVTALEDVSFDVNEGEFVSIVGPSGCGKSTLLYIIGGFIGADGGSVLVNGSPVSGPGRDRGIVFQEYALFPWKTVQGNIEFGLARSGMSKSERRSIVAKQISDVGLEGFERRYPRELSGGMKQRVAIARTLAYSPSVLLMDEPYGALDAQTRESMQDQLVEIWSSTRRTVVMVTHDVTEAVYLSQRIIVMAARPGRIVEDIKVDLDHSMPREDLVASEAFAQTHRQVWLSLHEGGTSGGGSDA